MLYDRDYNFLTDKEEAQYQKAQKFAYKRKEYTIKQLYHYHDLMPKAAYHYESLFPNNYLSIVDLEDHELLDIIKERFLCMLDKTPTERAILNFINENHYYQLLGTIFSSSYYFGHHGAYAFKEFELPPNFVADYLLVGKSSGGYQFIFVELESPEGSITNADGTFGTTIRKGLRQIEDWDAWIDSNYSHLKLLFYKHISPRESLPEEFMSLDKSRIHYTIIAGRRTHFKEKTYRQQRKLKLERNITLLHYDNLIDTLQYLKKSGTY